MATQRYLLKGLGCANCAAKMEQTMRNTKGLEESRVNFATSSAELNPEFLDVARQIITSIEPGVEVVPVEKAAPTAAPEKKSSVSEFFKEQRETVMRVLAAAILMVVGVLLEDWIHVTGLSWLEYVIFLGAYLIVGLEVLQSAFRNLGKGNLSHEHILMSIATIGAIVIHQLPEAVMVMLLYLLGEGLQDFAVNRSRRSIAALVSIRPDQARVNKFGLIVTMKPEQVKVGDQIVVQPGDRVPLDGEIIEGESFVDTSALTGESVPRRVGKGDKVLAGMVCSTGLLNVKVERPFAESAISRILEMVENAAGRKAKTEQVVTTFTRYYTPGVMALAAAVAIIPPLVVPGATFSAWVYRALVLLVVSCPCALVISVPLGYFGGIGAASRQGILVKGANFLDVLADVGTMVFDKTGTLTEGTFKVSSIQPHNGYTEAQVLETAALIEAASPHPIAASILATHGKPVDMLDLQDYEEVPGCGVRGRVGGRLILAGNDRFMHQADILHDEAVCEVPGTVVHVAADGVYYGYIVISDQVKAGAKEALGQLRSLDVSRLDMLSGDDTTAVEQVGRHLGLDQTWAQLLPGDKVAKMEELVSAPRRRRVAYVGDGINDAPVLTRADVGIAMGALGSDAAIEAADVVIMDDSLTKLPAAVRIARKTKAIVSQNIGFSLVIKGLFMLLGVLGLSNIWMAVFGDMGVSVLAVLNSARVLRYRAN
ncbi:MAG: heavy metal translocating P-type ATPase [Chitinophagales bacterium]